MAARWGSIRFVVLAAACAALVMSPACDSAEVLECETMPEHPDCIDECEPTMPTSCPSGESCAISVGAVASAVCVRAGTLDRGARCQSSSDCAVGLSCVSGRAGLVSVCVPVCSSIGARCPGDRGGVCTSFEPNVVIASVEYGYCVTD